MKICETSKLSEKKSDWDLLIGQTARFLAAKPTAVSQVNCINAAIERHGSVACGANRLDPGARYSVTYRPEPYFLLPGYTRLKGRHGLPTQQLLFTWLAATVPGLCVSDLATFTIWEPWEPRVLLPLLLGHLADSGKLAAALQAAKPPPGLAREHKYPLAAQRKAVAAARDAVARQPGDVLGSRLVKLFRSTRWPHERTQLLMDGVPNSWTVPKWKPPSKRRL